MNIKHRALPLFLLVLALLLSPAAGAHADTDYKWVRMDGKWYYCSSEGEFLTNWQKIEGVWFYFDENGVMQAGWQKIGGIWYLFSPGGAMQTGWQKVGGKWYYLNGDGVMQTGWLSLGSWDYYLTQSGAMATGWQKIDGIWYLFGPGGAMQTGWQKVGGKWYYFNGDGAMQTGWLSLGNWYYYLAQSGAMATGWQKIDGKWYFFNSGGGMITGWQKLGSNWYFMNTSGVMATGWQTIGERTYFFADGGVLADCPGEGAMLRGFHVIDGKVCVFAQGGALQEDWASKNVIVIDPGHSSEIPDGQVPLGPGSDEMKDADNYGAVSVTNGLHEYELVLDVSLMLRDKLEARGYKVIMVRTTNTGKYSCVDRAKVANDNNAAVFLRVHANAAPKDHSKNGAMTICITKDNEFIPAMYKKSRLLSDMILNNYVAAVGCYNEGVWERDDMVANNWSKVPTTLVELGYMTNEREDRLMQTSAYKEKMANGLLYGIDAYFKAALK